MDNEISLLKEQLKNYMFTTNNELNRITEKIEAHDKSIKEIEMTNAKTEFQYEQIIKSLEVLNEKTIPNLAAQIEELKNKPVKRYDQAITAILGAIFGAVGTFIVNLIIGGK